MNGGWRMGDGQGFESLMRAFTSNMVNNAFQPIFCSMTKQKM